MRLRSTGRHARPRVHRRHGAPRRRRPALHQIAVIATRTLVLAGLAAVPVSAALRQPVPASAGAPVGGRGHVAAGSAAAGDDGPAGLLTSDHAEAVARASRSSGRGPLPAVAVPPSPCVRPNEGPLSSSFGIRWGQEHAGIDLAGPDGSPILAACDGVVTFVGPADGFGRLVTIAHPDGSVTAYGHMAQVLVAPGAVRAGQLIALEGSEGRSTGPHLHFEVRIGDRPVDPLPWLAAHSVSVASG